MTFSIVIPTYNGKDFVEQTILSVLKQTRRADEIIISDDNSTDETIAICRKYSNNIKIYRNFNGPSGFVNGWNNAITYATGEYISILHQDDLLAPTFIEEIEKALTVYPEVRHLFVPCNYIDETGEVLQEPNYCNEHIHKYTGKEYVMAYQSVGHPHIHRCPGVVTHRDIFKVCQYRTEAGHIADDDFFYRVGQYTDIIGILKPLASYRLHQKSETGHLGSGKLIQRLADCYIYQIKQWKGNTFLEKESYAYFIHWALYFAFSEYWIGLIQKNQRLMIKGKRDIYELKYMGLRLPLKKRLAFSLTSLFTSK